MNKIIIGLCLVSLCACAATDTVNDKNDELKSCQELSAEMRVLEDKMGGSGAVADMGEAASDAATDYAVNKAWDEGNYSKADDISTAGNLASNALSIFSSSREKKRRDMERRYSRLKELHYQKCGMGKQMTDMQQKSLKMQEEALKKIQNMPTYNAK